MASTILIKRSAVPGKIPTTSNLLPGEFGLNTYDGALYFKKNVGGTETVETLYPLPRDPVFSYNSLGQLTGVVYGDGGQKTLSWSGDYLSTLISVRGGITTLKTYNFVNGVLQSITEEVI